MDTIISDLRYALRTLRQSPGFFSLVVGILALGVASSVSVFSLVDGILLRPLPYRDPQRLVTLTAYATRPPFDSNGSLSFDDFLQLKSKTNSFSDLAITFRTGWSRMVLTGGATPVPMQGAFVSPNLFTMFGRFPIIGRSFTSQENLHAERVVVISQALWAQRFGSSPQALGQDLEIGHARWRVIGVMPADFKVPFLDTQLWAPILSNPGWNDTEETNPPERPRWDVMGRLKPGVSLTAAQAEVDSIEKGLRAALPEFHPNSIRVVPLREHFTGDVRKPLLVLFIAVAFLLVIACANVANLMLARATERERELTIRSALGAAQTRLLRQLVTEGIAFSSIAGALGALGATAFVPVLKALSPAGTPLLAGVTMNTRSLVFALLLSVSVGVLLGIVPAWHIARRDLGESLSGATRYAAAGHRAQRLRSFLVAAEFALAMLLLTGAGLLIRSFVAVLRVDVGFRTANVLTVQVNLPDASSPSQVAQFYRDVMQRMAGLPGVQAVGGVSNLFFLDETRNHALRLVEGRPPEPKSLWKPLVWTQVTGDYFQAVGIPLLHGRFFNPKDNPDSPPVVIVNETLARRYWPGEDPVGKHLKGFDPRGRNDDWLTVIGVVKDTRSGGLERAPFSQIYEVQSQRGEQIGNLVIRTSVEPSRIASEVRTLIRNVNSSAVVSSIKTVEQLLDQQEVQRRFQTWLVATFSGLALALAALGVFAVMRQSVAAKTHEIGIRMAVGAEARDIVRLVLSNGTRLAAFGIVAGGIAATESTQAIASMLYKVRPTDMLSFGTAAGALLAISLLGSYVPARHASRIDPMSALRRN